MVWAGVLVADNTDDYNRDYKTVPGMAEALASIERENRQQPEPTMFQQTIIDLKRALKETVMPIHEDIRLAVTAFRNPLVLVTDNEFVKQARLKGALDELSSIPEGKELVDSLGKTKLELKDNPHYTGGTHWSTIDCKDANMPLTSNSVSVQGYATRGTIVSILAHELQHHRQTVAQVLRPFDDTVPSPIEQLWFNRIIEADAQATAIDIAWKLKEAGKEKAWNSIADPGMCGRELVNAYQYMAFIDPSSVADGRAKRAAFDEWFVAKNIFGEKMTQTYNGQGVNNALCETRMEEAMKSGKPFAPMDVGDIEQVGDLSKVNYLKIPGGRPLDDKYYRSPDWNDYEAGCLKRLHNKYDELQGQQRQSKFMKPAEPEVAKPSAPEVKEAKVATVAPKVRAQAFKM